MRLKIAVLAGDGIGPEVTREATNILRAVAELGGIRGIVHRSVDEPYAGVEGGVDGLHRHRVIGTALLSEQHGAEADGR